MIRCLHKVLSITQAHKAKSAILRQQGDFGETSLDLAISAKRTAIITLLLEGDECHDLLSKIGELDLSPLETACRTRDTELIVLVLDKMRDGYTTETAEPMTHLLLKAAQYALQKDEADILMAIYDRFPDFDATLPVNDKPLNVACRHGKDRVINAILSREDVEKIVTECTDKKTSPYILATFFDQANTLHLLFSNPKLKMFKTIPFIHSLFKQAVQKNVINCLKELDVVFSEVEPIEENRETFYEAQLNSALINGWEHATTGLLNIPGAEERLDQCKNSLISAFRNGFQELAEAVAKHPIGKKFIIYYKVQLLIEVKENHHLELLALLCRPELKKTFDPTPLTTAANHLNSFKNTEYSWAPDTEKKLISPTLATALSHFDQTKLTFYATLLNEDLSPDIIEKEFKIAIQSKDIIRILSFLEHQKTAPLLNKQDVKSVIANAIIRNKAQEMRQLFASETAMKVLNELYGDDKTTLPYKNHPLYQACKTDSVTPFKIFTQTIEGKKILAKLHGKHTNAFKKAGAQVKAEMMADTIFKYLPNYQNKWTKLHYLVHVSKNITAFKKLIKDCNMHTHLTDYCQDKGNHELTPAEFANTLNRTDISLYISS